MRIEVNVARAVAETPVKIAALVIISPGETFSISSKENAFP